MTQDNKVRKRASRHIRQSSPRRFRLTARDVQVLQAVNDCRVLRQDQLQRLFFPSRNTAQVRLQLLWQHGYLRREFLNVVGGIQTSHILYVMDKRGVELLQSQYGYEPGDIRWSRKRLDFQFIDHTLGIAETRIAAELSCRQHSLQLKKWIDERALKGNYDRVQIGNKYVSVLPDAYLVIGLAAGDMHFFIEYDRGPESPAFLKQKLTAYSAYFHSGKCKQRYGTDRIRVLIITQSGDSGREKRFDNLRKLAGEMGDGRWFWFSRQALLSTNDFLTGTIWWLSGSNKAHGLLASQGGSAA